MKFAEQENVPPLSEELFWSLILACPKGGTILELGSGETTAELAKYRNVISIEDDPYWMNRHNKPENYIHIPLEAPAYFYNAGILAEKLSGLKYDVLLVDGPSKDSRAGEFIKVMHWFNPDVPWFIDDWSYYRFVEAHNILKTTIGREVVPFTRSLKQWAVVL